MPENCGSSSKQPLRLIIIQAYRSKSKAPTTRSTFTTPIRRVFERPFCRCVVASFVCGFYHSNPTQRSMELRIDDRPELADVLMLFACSSHDVVEQREALQLQST